MGAIQSIRPAQPSPEPWQLRPRATVRPQRLPHGMGILLQTARTDHGGGGGGQAAKEGEAAGYYF